MAVMLIVGAVRFRAVVREQRTGGATVGTAALTAGLSVMPPPLAWMVRNELAALRLAWLVIRRRVDGAGPQDLPISYKGGKRAHGIIGALFLLGGLPVVELLDTWSLLDIMAPLAETYTLLLLCGAVGGPRIRPRLLGPELLRVRWGTREELRVALEDVVATKPERASSGTVSRCSSTATGACRRPDAPRCA
ncbi:hypothetical protein [Streptomyces sp. CT34]|uniref:hypothetical protein n=1 Tax=Streptomyces sp. CT34 TaxID=1553907 RepID=UPI0005BD695F|nr:hypothetical protein [Streptomyces sp. CT34]